MTKPVTRRMAVDCLLDRVIRQLGAPLICGICGEPILPGQAIQFDHVHSDAMGGSHIYRNLRPVHYDPCHKRKSKNDVAALAKVDRITGVTKNQPKQKIQSRPFPKAQRPMRKK